MSDPAKRVSIWFFIGILLLAYGALIFGTGVYELFVPPEHPVVMAQLRPAIWWGGLLLLLGAFYCYRFAPPRSK
jgi:hypothetical protein